MLADPTHQPVDAAPSDPSWAGRLSVLLLGVAIVYATVMQGAFYADAAAVVMALVVVAAVLALFARLGCRAGAVPKRPTRRVEMPASPRRWHVALAAGLLLLLALWTAGRAVVVGGPVGLWAGLPFVVLASAVVAVAGVGPRARDVLHVVLLAGGLLVAGSGWIGVAWHVDPLALPSSGLWRASSTLTYANATAAYLVTTLLLTTATVRLAPRAARLVTAVLLVGLLATMSRAGLATLALGMLVVACGVPQRRLLAAGWTALPGAAVAAAGLLPGLAAGSTPHPLVAVAGLCAGLGLAASAPGRARTSALVVLGVSAALVTSAAVWHAQAQPGAAVDALVGARLSADSPERDDLARVTLAQFVSAPLTGVGPGRLDLLYVDHAGRLVVAEYTHDEFLQTAAETGVVGAGLAIGVFCCLGAAAVRRRHTGGGLPAAAILVAFAAHSAVDFLWHIPVLPLLVVAAVVPLLDRPSPHEEAHHEEEVMP